MTEAQKLQIKASEQRSRLNELAAVESLTDEQRSELDSLTGEYQDTERRWRAAALAEGEPEVETRQTEPTDAEHRERVELRGRASFGAYLAAALAGRTPAGAESEYSAACRVGPGEVPLDLFEADRPTEHRADATTPAPSTGTGATLGAIHPYVFAQSVAPRLGIGMPSVGSGSYSEATITTAATAAARAKGGVQESTALALTPVTATPRRISARLSIAAEDVALVGNASFESSLRQNAQMALSDEYDEQCIAGNGTSPNVEGLIKQLTDPTDPTAVADFDAYLKAFSDQIDGLWASMLSEVAIVANVDAYKLSATKFRDVGTNNGHRGDTSFADYARTHTGGWWTNKRMPATASNIARGIVHRKGRAGLTTAVHPTWGSLSIDDVYTDSASATRHFTLHVLVGSKVLITQPSAYGLVEFKVA